ncbi:MAG TPA: hypothetical protein VLF43_01595, partial [Candidatus Saccharimonadales bacterium]|nr:hypothetical protein [Candidatus Saccharimonadales bacterium]
MQHTILMVPADHYAIEYEINAWMHQEDHANRAIAKQEWQKLYDIYTKQLGRKVVLADPVEH